MSDHNKSPQAADTATAQPTIKELVQPLPTSLQAQYPTSNGEEYEIPSFDRFGDDYQNEDRILIELPDDIKEHEQALAAVATILKAAGSMQVWGCGGRYDAEYPLVGPLRISYITRVAGADSFWARSRYIQIDDGGAVFDSEKAAQQIAGLVDLISNGGNLIKLSDWEKALF